MVTLTQRQGFGFLILMGLLGVGVRLVKTTIKEIALNSVTNAQVDLPLTTVLPTVNIPVNLM